MKFLVSIWVSLGTITAFIWFVRNLLIGSILREREYLRSPDDAHRVEFAKSPKVSVLVAARDEETNIESCVRGLLDQDYPNFELIAVDDRSRDTTPAILMKLRNEFGDRFHVLTVRALPDGWFGKNNAMREGVDASTGEWLLFTDADCRFSSRKAISAAMNDARETASDFLTVIPELESRETWERILQPVCSLVLMFWFQPRKVNDPKCRVAYANGAFMLIRRPCYDAIGGHGAVRAQLNEDIHMAQAAKRLGMRLRVVENDGHYHTRMYATPRAALRGWSRIFAGSLSSTSRIVLAAVTVAFSSIFPWLGLAIGIVGAMSISDPSIHQRWIASMVVWGIAAGLMQFCIGRVYAAVGFGRRWSLLYSPAALVVFVILLNALAKVSGVQSVTWRGTKYRAGLQPATSGQQAATAGK